MYMICEGIHDVQNCGSHFYIMQCVERDSLERPCNLRTQAAYRDEGTLFKVFFFCVYVLAIAMQSLWSKCLILAQVASLITNKS